MITTTPAQAIKDLKARGTAHHAHHLGRSVAFRLQADGRIESRYSDGVVHADLNEAEALIMAECYLGLPITPDADEVVEPAKPAKARMPAKKASIRLARGWSVALRRDEVFPEDPGMGCPAVVCGPFGAQRTYWCASNEGVVEVVKHGIGEDIEIPAHIFRVLQSQEVEDAVNGYVQEVTDWLAKNPR